MLHISSFLIGRFIVRALFVIANLIAHFSSTILGADVSQYNVIWDSPSADCRGSMPLGNGDIGLIVWALADGTLHLLISKTDAWEDNSRLVKVGEAVVRFERNPFVGKFRQELDLKSGSILFQDHIRVWVDANHPAVHVTTDLPATASIELWRTHRTELATLEVSDIMLNRSKPRHKEEPTFIEPDTVLSGQKNRIGWYHHNIKSVGPEITARIQGMTEFKHSDPILRRTFGAMVTAAKAERVDNTHLRSAGGFDIFVLTQTQTTPENWLSGIEDSIRSAGATDFAAHQIWWSEFWGRSWIQATDRSGDAAYVSQMYALQRFIGACAGRGAYPIKFNGSLFTVSPNEKSDHDYRRWGPGYWWQNTRLPYMSMCSAGDFEMMKPLFHMYGDELLPMCKYRTKLYLGHDGAFYPECINFWGTMFSETYGWTPFEKRKDKLQESGYHKYEWVGGLELCWLMLDYYEHTLDRAFLENSALPVCREILTFFDQHYKTRPDGKLVMQPSQALETWWQCTNPMPELAGCTAVSERLLALSEISADDRSFLKTFREKLPALPLREINGKKALAPAEKFAHKANIETPELYAVFPFRLFALGKPNIEWAIEALHHRTDKGDVGWRQDDLFMAYLGLANEARDYVVGRARKHDKNSRFPAFWGPNYDWVPDQDHGSVLLKGVQSMLLQADAKKIFLLPAWPAGWDCEFKLHAPYQTVVAGKVREGKLIDLEVSPPDRKQDVVLP